MPLASISTASLQIQVAGEGSYTFQIITRDSEDRVATSACSAVLVVDTTPPQPASKARNTLYFLSVGGALANQNGLGDLMPRKAADMSAM